MSPDEFRRKLTAVFSADVAGYSRLMGEDEVETVKTLTAYRKIMGELIQQHRGRVIDSPGDNILAEFVSVVDAVQCAVAAQNEFKSRNAELPENRRMEFRIGVNLGDVIEEESRIYGDGVNIAARLEALADPGGICISKTAFDHIESKLPLGYEYLGEQQVKNIAKPVGAYRVLMEPRVTVAEGRKKEEAVPGWRRKAIVAGGVAIALVVITALIWNFYFRTPPTEVASKERMAFPLTDKPSIAVLPFVNMSDDPKQEYFSDGMAEDLITDLSRIPSLLVISRNSSFAFKGKSMGAKEIAEKLDVQYVLEGSVRKANDQVRINAQLIDAKTEHHLWAERYDGSLRDIFTLQDRITQKIVASLALKLTEGELEQLYLKETKNVEAYNAFLKGLRSYYMYSAEGIVEAISFFEEAIKLDPNYSRAYAGLARAYQMSPVFVAHKLLGISFKESHLRKMHYLGIAMKNPTSLSQRVAAWELMKERQWEEGVAHQKSACALDPSDQRALQDMGWFLVYAGRPDESFEYINRALRIDPACLF